MRNIKLGIEYIGTAYCGWQTQKKKSPTVEQKLKDVLTQILQENVKLKSACRTDSGVHARGQVVNFYTNKNYSCETIKKSLNSLLPSDIKVIFSKEVGKEFDARFSARKKIYRYCILNREFPSVFSFPFCWHIPEKLAWGEIYKASKYFLGTYDFSSFAGSGSQRENNICTIFQLDIHRQGNYYYFLIEGDRFLYHMVRNIVGTLVEVGRGKIKSEEMSKIIDKKDRKFAGPTAPAKGLTLLKVKYL